jgi:hypothetical protein
MDKIALWIDDALMPRHWWVMTDDERQQDQWAWVKTYEQAILELGTGKYRHVSLDFSLDETDPRHCGLDVAKWILQEAEAGRLPRLSWAIHSIHPRADEMLPFLKAADQSWKAREPEEEEPLPQDKTEVPKSKPPRVCRCGAEIKNPGRFCDDCVVKYKRKYKKPRK